MKWRFGIIGGDRRQAELARMLAQDGHFVTTYGLDSGENMLKGRLEQALSADVVILPLPLCAKPGMITCAAEEIPVEALLEQLQPTQLILGGRVKAEEQRMAQARGLQLPGLLFAGRTDSGQCCCHSGSGASGGDGAFGPDTVGNKLSGAGFWAHWKAAEFPAPWAGSAGDSRSQKGIGPCMDSGLWLECPGHRCAYRRAGAISCGIQYGSLTAFG